MNVGVCEQSMIGMAAGLALEGFKPYIYTITPFFERAFEQIKLDVAHQNQNVKMVGFADYPGLGPTHTELDWRVLGETMPNLHCYFPTTREDARKAIIQSYEHGRPTFISLKKAKAL